MMFKFEQNRPASICVGSIIFIALASYKDDIKTHTPFYRQMFQIHFLDQKFKQASISIENSTEFVYNHFYTFSIPRPTEYVRK